MTCAAENKASLDEQIMARPEAVLHHCLHGSARQVVIGHVPFKGKA
jgi:hypothetical protein